MTEYPPVYEKTDSIFDAPVVINPTEGKFTAEEIEVDQWNVGKVQVVEYPYQLPSKCACCGGVPNNEFANTRYFIDWGLSLDGYGQVYICTDCFISTAIILGYVSPKAANTAAEEMTQLQQENAYLRSEVESIKSGLASLSDIGVMLGNPDKYRLIREVHDESAGKLDEIESGIDSPADEQRTDDISSTPSDDDDSTDIGRQLRLDE